MNITSNTALAIGVNFLFAIHRPCIPEDIRFYLDLALELRFLNDWEEDDKQLTLTFYEGTQKCLDTHASSTLEFLKEQVEFFVEAIGKVPVHHS